MSEQVDVRYGAAACIIHPALPGVRERRDEAALLEEARGLAGAIALDIRFAELVKIRQIQPGTLFGKGQAEEIGLRIRAEECELAVVDGVLSPVQQQSLEKAWKCKVIDRTALILEIFGERAQTNEGRLQVELAALEYQKGRLVRSWTHLERQRGGAGFLGGPGERQIESDRRQIQEQIHSIRKRLDKVVKTRTLHRRNRAAVPYPVVALVGYTNAGKSTLFNRLTKANVLAQDALFATLDPMMRLIRLPSGRKVIFSDTVGFIANLPTELVAAFRATLEEVMAADILLHVRDMSNPDSVAQKMDVLDVLTGILPQDAATPMVEVWNKADLLDSSELPAPLPLTADNNETMLKILPDQVRTSALKGEGCDTLLAVVDTLLAEQDSMIDVMVHAGNGKIMQWLYRHVSSMDVAACDEDKNMLKVRGQISAKLEAEFNAMMALNQSDGT